MRELMAQVYAQGGCATSQGPCKPAQDLLVKGGDTLALYLIRQLEETERGGYPNNDTYLSYIGGTQSETGFDYVRDRILSRPDLSAQDRRWAVAALKYTANPRAIDLALELTDDPDRGVRDRAVIALREVSIATNELRPDVLDKLLELREKRWVLARSSVAALNEHFELGLEGVE